MTESAHRGASYAEHPFRRVVADFTLDEGRKPRRSGYRPHWWITQGDADPFPVGLNQMSLIGTEWVQPGETRRAAFEFHPAVQGYIEHLAPGDAVEIRDGGHRVGSARIVEFIY